MNEENERSTREFRLISVLLDDDQRYIGEIENCYSKLKAKYFSDPQAKFAYDVMRSVYQSQGRTATLDEIEAINNGKHPGLKNYLSDVKTQAMFYRDSLKTFCDKIYEAYVNDRLISLTLNQTGVNEVFRGIDALCNDNNDFCYSVDEKKANVFECLTSGQYRNDIEKQRSTADIPTGFPILDALLGSKDGKKGLFPERLYVIGAVPSLGKTTFVHQIADNIAASGAPVLFFSLEQSQNELISKSIVREQHKIRINSKKDVIASPLNVMIKIGLDQPHIQAAIEAYKATAQNMYIYEGNFNTTIDTIRATVKRFIRANRKTPVVIVDYLQILKPANDKTKDARSIVDENITALKILARETQTAVFVISSFSRQGYDTAASFKQLKESGSIEYSADTVFSLQLDIDAKENYSEAFKRMNDQGERLIKLECLKNRGGQSTFTCYYSYKPKWEYFSERSKDTSQ